MRVVHRRGGGELGHFLTYSQEQQESSVGVGARMHACDRLISLHAIIHDDSCMHIPVLRMM